MSVSGLSIRSQATMQNVLSLRAQLDDLQRQLGTGKKSNTYAGLGVDRGLTVGLRAQLAKLTSFDSTIKSVGTRLTLAQAALQNIDTLMHQVKNAAQNSAFVIDASGQTTDQKGAANQLDSVISLLNTQVGDQYIFSGKSSDTLPVESSDLILNGDGVRAGLKTLIDERAQADVGPPAGLGRLVIPPAVGAVVSIAQDSATSPFGLKFAAASTTLSGATLTGPTGSPPAVSVDLGATLPNEGEALSMTFDLPDGTRASVTLRATTQSPPGENQFTIGADTDATAVNLQDALTKTIGKLAGSTLKAASAVQASNEFFAADADHPPLRVQGSPASAATALAAGTAADTVIWYKGEAGTTPARATATTRVDDGIVVNTGARANEDALRAAVQNIATFAAVSYSNSDPNAADSYAALRVRVTTNLDSVPGQQKIGDIQSDLAGAQTALQGAQERHTQTANTLQNLLQSIEGVSQEEVGVQILSLQTSLQATLQTTSLLYRTSLVNYI